MKLMNMTSTMTMTSLEVVAVINSYRDEDAAQLRHDDFLRKVRKIADEISLRNISEGTYKNSRNQKQPCLLLDKKACLLMVASETPKVLQAIIDRWLELEAAELERSTAKAMDAENRAALRMEYRPMTDALKSVREDIGKETKAHHYSNEADLINRIVTGYPAKKFKAVHEMPDSSLRDLLTPIQKQAMLSLQKANTVYLEEGLSFDERKARLNTLFNRRWNAKLIEECHLLCE